jgi:hypothetical protein
LYQQICGDESGNKLRLSLLLTSDLSKVTSAEKSTLGKKPQHVLFRQAVFKEILHHGRGGKTRRFSPNRRERIANKILNTIGGSKEAGAGFGLQESAPRFTKKGDKNKYLNYSHSLRSKKLKMVHKYTFFFFFQKKH